MEYTHNRKKRYLPRAELMLINPGEVHSGQPVVLYSFLNMKIPPLFMREIFERLQQPYPTDMCFTQEGLCTHQTKQLFFDFHKATESKNITSMELSEKAWMFFGHLVDSYTKRETLHTSYHAKLCKRAIDFIEAHFSDSLSLGQMAQVTHLSPYHFLRMFKKYVGMTPHQFVMCLRVEKALKFMEDGYSCAEVAHLVGFCDQSHLTRMVKRHSSLTPRDLKRVLVT